MTDFKDYLPENSTRKREDIEWCIFYSFNAADDSSLRVLTVGDSICYQYKDFLRDELADIMNLTSWATSKCVTDVNYIKDLKNILEYNRYDLVTFNNGLHYLSNTTPFEEWEKAYCRTLEYINAELPGIALAIVSCTPVNNAEKNQEVIKLNELTKKIADKFELPFIDLYSEMDRLDRTEYWSDEFHFTESAKILQARIMAEKISALLAKKIACRDENLIQKSSLTGPEGAIK